MFPSQRWNESQLETKNPIVVSTRVGGDAHGDLTASASPGLEVCEVDRWTNEGGALIDNNCKRMSRGYYTEDRY